MSFKVNYEELYNTAPCGYACSLPDGKIVEVNNRFLKFTGFSREEVLEKKKLSDFLTKAGRIYYDSSFLVILKLQGFIEEISFSFVRKDDSQFPVLINSSEVKDAEGKCLYVQSTVFDISQRKNFENQLLSAKKNADELTNDVLAVNDELKNFAYIATHDLKAPVLDIEGHFNYLKKKLPTENKNVNESIDFVDLRIKQFKRTVEDLTSAVKVRNTKAELDEINLPDLLVDVLSDFKSKVAELKGVLTSHFEHSSVILGNKVYVESILQNVIGNSIKYRDQERPLEIKITSKELKLYVCIEVRDNGIGIDLEQHKKKVFDMFSRFHNHTEGTGMGLFISKQMIIQMKGKIEIESQPNVGTIMNLYFRKKL